MDSILMAMESYPPLLNVKQLQEIMQIGENRAYDFFKKDDIEVIKIGKHLRICKVDLAKYLAKTTINVDKVV
jgi:predicted transcriptional regulator